jgi:eukaryotic-like serine/threonine-protein kinase
LTESGSFPYIEMEFIEGPDLEDLLKAPHDGVFSVKEVIKLADHLANALAHCHLYGVKHGDVKSNNVKYNIHSGNYVLLDFGLAIMSDEQRRTSIRHAGAIEFMAPEQNAGTMLFQTDVYSYGIILYELLAGQVPFPLHDNGETSRNAVMIAHMETPVPDLMDLRKKNLPASWAKEKKEQEMRVPQWLLNIVSTCLEKDPENRYGTGMALQEALVTGILSAELQQVVLAEEPVIDVVESSVDDSYPERPSPVYHDGDKMLINKPLFFGLMGLLLLALSTSGYLLYDKDHTEVPVTKPLKDSVANQTPDTSAKTQPVADYHAKKKATDSVTQQAIDDNIEKARQKTNDDQQKTDSTNGATDTTKHPDNN